MSRIQDEAQKAVKVYGTIGKAAKALGIHPATLRRRMSGSLNGGPNARMKETTEAKPTWEVETSDDKIQVLSISDRIRTEADAITYGEIDTAVWYVHSKKIGAHECPMKLGAGLDEKGRKTGPDRPAILKMWRVELVLKRRVAQVFEEGAKLIIERMVKHAPKYPKAPRLLKITDPHMLEVSIFDSHFGKLAWGAETGQNYDLKIAESIYWDAVQGLVKSAAAHPIEKILFPVGQDFFHVDGIKGQTTAGTQVDYDCRFAKIFMAGWAACVKAIDFLAAIAPVHVPWVPGNHDATASYHLAAMLWAHYQRSSGRVVVDMSPKTRKLVTYGTAAIGFTHGDKERHNDLVNIFQGEFRKEIVDCQTLEIHLGHRHVARETRYVCADTMPGGVRVRILPSLSGCDAWHYTSGYVGGMRAAEAYLWSKSRGYAGHFSYNVPPEN